MHLFWKYKLDHALFWCITIVFYAFVTADLWQQAGLYHYSLNIIVRNGLLALICYANIYYLFPLFFRKGRYLLFFAGLAVSLIFYTVMKNIHDTWLYGYVLGDLQKQPIYYNSFYNFSIAVFYLTFTMALALSKNWYQQHSLLQKMQVEKLTTELQYLKAQINPHFLFNSINTIYFQIEKTNTAARDSLQKFSELLRYQLYECNEDRIGIEKEIVYLQSYIDLQRLRRQAHYHIGFTVQEGLGSFAISPLLLIVFVENACKHVSDYTDRLNRIKINLYRQNENLCFDVVNTKRHATKPSNTNCIGLKNVKRRLELLYAGRHQLDIQNNADLYSVHLTLKI